MNVEEIRERARSSPEWLLVEVFAKLEEYESRLKTLETKPKPGRPRKVKNGTE